MNYYNINYEYNKISKLKAGTILYISGIVYTMRDRTLKNIFKETFPPILKNATIFHAAPTLNNSNNYFSCGPTTANRMDGYLDFLFKNNIFATIGKGRRDINIHKKYKKIYLMAIGGAGALYGMCVKSNKKIMYKDLKVESLNCMEIDKFPVIIGIDIYGNSI